MLFRVFKYILYFFHVVWKKNIHLFTFMMYLINGEMFKN